MARKTGQWQSSLIVILFVFGAGNLFLFGFFSPLNHPIDQASHRKALAALHINISSSSPSASASTSFSSAASSSPQQSTQPADTNIELNFDCMDVIKGPWEIPGGFRARSLLGLSMKWPRGTHRWSIRFGSKDDNEYVFYISQRSGQIVMNNKLGMHWGDEQTAAETFPRNRNFEVGFVGKEHSMLVILDNHIVSEFFYRQPWALDESQTLIKSVWVGPARDSETLQVIVNECLFWPDSKSTVPNQDKQLVTVQTFSSVAQQNSFFAQLAAMPNHKCVFRAVNGCEPEIDAPSSEIACTKTIKSEVAGYCEIHDQDQISPPLIFKSAWCGHTLFSCDLFVFRAGLAQVISSAEQQQKQKQHQQQQQFSNGSLPPSPPSRGIIILVYEKVLASAFVLCSLLRELGCTLPIQLWYREDEIHIDSALPHHITQHIPAVAFHKMTTTLSGYLLKPFALAASDLDQILLLDVDNFPLRDPTFLFEAPEFAQHGALFWPDFWHPHSKHNSAWHIRRDSAVWELIGVPFVFMFEGESGQLVVDKRQSTVALQVLKYFVENFTFFSRGGHILGDKDLFRFAWLATNTTFHMIHTPPGTAGVLLEPTSEFCGGTMVQHDLSGDLLFMHRNMFKLEHSGSNKRFWFVMQHADSAAPANKELQVRSNGRFKWNSEEGAFVKSNRSDGMTETYSCWVHESPSATVPVPEVVERTELRMLELLAVALQIEAASPPT